MSIADHDRPGPGTLRGLRAITTADGRVAAVAVDQRQALRTMLAAAGAPAGAADLRAFKLAVARALGDVAPALLVDPQYGLPAIAGDPSVSARLPLLVAIEESGTVAWKGGERSVGLAGWGPQEARNAGACAAKLLVYLRADHPATLEHGLALATSVRRACRAADLPFILELVPFPLADEDPTTYAAAFGRHVRAIAEVGASLAPDLLKIPFPSPLGSDDPETGALAALAELGVPWAVLSAGADVDRFVGRVLRSLDEGGAVGLIAGRALWKDAVGARDVAAALAAGARPRLERLLATIAGRGRPLPLPAVSDDPGWFRR
jgi:tagatose-1,6-bisphosphate aldolase